MKKIITGPKQIIRSKMENINISEDQTEILNKFYMNCLDPSQKNLHKLITQELSKKQRSYKEQDISKKIFCPNTIINTEQIINKLVSSKLKCHYCKTSTLILYKYKREPKQWTLDRIDNSIGHTDINTLISCLQCNLQRRNINKDKFLFTKQLKIVKSN